MSARSDPAALDLEQLRTRRRELQELDDAVSYVRRVAQGRADLVRAELARREGGATGHDLAGDLRLVLADRLLAGSDRPPRPTKDFGEHPLAAELDVLCAEKGFGRLDDLDPEGLSQLANELDGFERRVSAERHDLYVELDALTGELVRRYREDGVHPEGDRDGGAPA